MARDKNPVQAEEKKQFTRAYGTLKCRGGGQPDLGVLTTRDTQVLGSPTLGLLSHFLCMSVSFFPTTHGLLRGVGSLAMEISLVAPLLSSEQPRETVWPSWDQVLTSLKHLHKQSIPICHYCQYGYNRKPGRRVSLSQNAC